MTAYLKSIGEQVSKIIQNYQRNYGSDLEQYIISHNPSCPADVDRLTLDYNTKVTKGFL